MDDGSFAGVWLHGCKHFRFQLLEWDIQAWIRRDHIAKRRKKKEPEEERGVPQASQEEFSSLAALDPPPQYGPKVDITVEINGKPLRVHPELYKLFPHRNPTQLEELRNSINRHGQGGKVVLLDKGDRYIILDGHDTVQVIGLLQQEGQDIELQYEVYTPLEPSNEGAYLECMQFVIRRKFQQTTVEITTKHKSAAILKYLREEAAQNLYRTSSWIARDLSCSATYVDNVRTKAIAKGWLPEVDSYRSFTGASRPAKYKVDANAELKALKIRSLKEIEEEKQKELEAQRRQLEEQKQQEAKDSEDESEDQDEGEDSEDQEEVEEEEQSEDKDEGEESEDKEEENADEEVITAEILPDIPSTQVETITPATEEVSQVNTEARLEGALKAVMDSIEATGEETIVAPWSDPVRERQLTILRNWAKHPEQQVELPEEEFRAYAPLFPGFSGVFMENTRSSYDVT
jgi:hypothetical protein